MSNQNNSENSNQNLLSEQSQAWLESVLKHTQYCHYFAVGMDDNKYPIGDWHAPFYSIEEATQFKDMMQAKHPDRDFSHIEGMLHIDSAMKNTPNKFWATWQKKHKERIASLKTKGGSHNA
ncbi:hypothetical protein [Acinetobacter sp.]|uniref:hypothetical protein n=1 Tax=Acinetobacter sp. TaxID=472 RepID=UPI0026308EB5|nr:hypothetical protein [Acinetobacter sp.]MDD2944529.1 hypothetical protein [Acinetobacter sp.]